MKASRQILCIEDDAHIGHLICLQLRDLGHQAEWVADGEQGLQRALAQRFDMVILDLKLPNCDGFEICSQIRVRNWQTPVVMLTAKAGKHDIIRGLELGADEYITKPFSMPVFVARIEALFRRIAVDRAHQDTHAEPFDCCGFVVDPQRREIRRNNQSLPLTAKEFDLLTLFARNPGRVYSRAEILKTVWGEEFEGYDHTVNTHINRLRNKIEPDPAKPVYIETIWGVGYCFSRDLAHNSK